MRKNKSREDCTHRTSQCVEDCGHLIKRISHLEKCVCYTQSFTIEKGSCIERFMRKKLHTWKALCTNNPRSSTRWKLS